MHHDAESPGSPSKTFPLPPQPVTPERQERFSVRPPLDLLEAYLNLSDELFCEAGYDGFVRWVNPSWERHLGYAPRELLESPFVDLLHPADDEELPF